MLDTFAASDASDQYTGIRYPGLVRTFTISAIFCLASLFLFRLSQIAPFNKIVYYSILLCFWFSAVLNARTGVVLGLLAIILYALSYHASSCGIDEGGYNKRSLRGSCVVFTSISTPS